MEALKKKHWLILFVYLFTENTIYEVGTPGEGSGLDWKWQKG